MIEPIGSKLNMTPITKTAPVGPRLQPEKTEKPEKKDAEALRTERDTVQNQLTTVKGLADAPAEQISALESKLQTAQDNLAAAEENAPAKPTALERLQGKMDTYEAAGEEDEEGQMTTTIDTASPDREIEGLKKKEQDLKTETAAAEKRGDGVAWEQLKKQLKAVQSEITQKDNDTYRKSQSSVTEAVK